MLHRLSIEKLHMGTQVTGIKVFQLLLQKLTKAELKKIIINNGNQLMCL